MFQNSDITALKLTRKQFTIAWKQEMTPELRSASALLLQGTTPMPGEGLEEYLN